MISNFIAADEPAAMCRCIRGKIESGKRDVAGLGRLVDRVLATVPEKDELAELGALLDWAKGFRYTRDPVAVDTIRSAALSGKDAVTSTILRGQGDCDDLSAVLGAAAEYAGYPVRLVVTGPGGNWKHVYPEALTRKHGWVSMDPTEKHRPLGWRARLPRAIFDKEAQVLVPEEAAVLTPAVAGLAGLYAPLSTDAAAVPSQAADLNRGGAAGSADSILDVFIPLAGLGLLVLFMSARVKRKGRRA